jgi:hypothetical protein
MTREASVIPLERRTAPVVPPPPPPANTSGNATTGATA